MPVIRNTNQSLRPRLPPEIILLIAEDDSLEWEDLRRLRHACPVLFDELGSRSMLLSGCRSRTETITLFADVQACYETPKSPWRSIWTKAPGARSPNTTGPLLMAMVVFSITGVQLEKDLEDQREGLANKEERYLLRHGCMPVRSLKVVHYRQTENTQQQ
ncbi:hypothetical protein QL093DRAFT_2092760 [Fusarium oxysporum]|nr:hypothetical protein QL093DRAFT_2092760 [Fusarium oxysporum]